MSDAPPLCFVTVQVGNYCGRGADYVNIMADMVLRNLGQPFRFICYTDDPAGLDPRIEARTVMPGLKGWWAKLQLFRRGEFTEGQRVVYLDLDTVVMSGLVRFIEYEGEFACLRDFYRPHGLGSGIMLWRGGFGAGIWDRWEAAGRPEIDGGDQAWLEQCGLDPDRVQDLWPGHILSFKADRLADYPESVPPGTWIVCFHGEPRPHNCGHRVIGEVWKIGGTLSPLWIAKGSAPAEEVLANVAAALALDLPHLSFGNLPRLQRGGRHMVLVGGGPSLADTLPEIRRRQQRGQDVWALNGAHDYLLRRGLRPDYHCLLDARQENARFVRRPVAGCRYFVASQCHPEVFAGLAGFDTVMWHAAYPGVEPLLRRLPEYCLIPGGNTVLTKATSIGLELGYRSFHLYGCDSSYRDANHHAYAQDLNDGERCVTVTAQGRQFRAARWMVHQCEILQAQRRLLKGMGCAISAHGDGLVPHVFRELDRRDRAAAAAA